MKDDALLINTARGGLIDSTALVGALQTGKQGGAGIDVLRREPPVDGDPLLDVDLDNLIVTPHIALAAREARQRALEQIAQCVESFTAGGNFGRVVEVSTAVVWFRRDLRLADNPALEAAANRHDRLVLLYIDSEPELEALVGRRAHRAGGCTTASDCLDADLAESDKH